MVERWLSTAANGGSRRRRLVVMAADGGGSSLAAESERETREREISSEGRERECLE